MDVVLLRVLSCVYVSAVYRALGKERKSFILRHGHTVLCLFLCKTGERFAQSVQGCLGYLARGQIQTTCDRYCKCYNEPYNGSVLGTLRHSAFDSAQYAGSRYAMASSQSVYHRFPQRVQGAADKAFDLRRSDRSLMRNMYRDMLFRQLQFAYFDSRASSCDMHGRVEYYLLCDFL